MFGDISTNTYFLKGTHSSVGQKDFKADGLHSILHLFHASNAPRRLQLERTWPDNWTAVTRDGKRRPDFWCGHGIVSCIPEHHIVASQGSYFDLFLQKQFFAAKQGMETWCWYLPQRWLDRFHSAIKRPRPLPDIDSCCCWRYPKTKNSRGFSMFSTWRSAQFEHTFLVTEWGHPVPARFHEQSATEPNRETEDWCWGPHGACGDWPASWTKFKGKRVKKLAWDSLHSACDFDMIFPYFGFLVYFWYVQMISDVKMSKRCRMFGPFWMVLTMSYSRTCMPPYNPAPRLNWLPFHILSECLSAQNAALAVTGEAMFQRWRNLIVDRASTPKSLSFEKRSKVVIEKNMSCLAPLSKSKWLKHFYELLLKLRFHAGFQASNSLQRCIFSNGLPPRQ